METKEVKLIKLKLLKGKENLFQEWMDFLNKSEHRTELAEGLNEEKVKAESIFRLEENGETFVYWYMAMEDLDYAMKVATASKRPTDIQHFRYFAQCIDPAYRVVVQDQFTLII
jgi:hypothetical protein